MYVSQHTIASSGAHAQISPACNGIKTNADYYAIRGARSSWGHAVTEVDLVNSLGNKRTEQKLLIWPLLEGFAIILTCRSSGFLQIMLTPCKKAYFCYIRLAIIPCHNTLRWHTYFTCDIHNVLHFPIVREHTFLRFYSEIAEINTRESKRLIYFKLTPAWTRHYI